MAKLRVVACGGGTGGHYYPSMAVLKRLQEVRELEILYFTVPGKIDDRSVEKDFPGVKRVPLKVKGLKRPLYKPENIGIVFHHLAVQKDVVRTLMKFRPDLIFSTGGFISFPVVKGASKLGIKVFLHEQNSIPGIANKKMAKYADRVFVSFEESASKFPAGSRILCTGNPVRKTTGNRKELLSELGFSPEEPFVVVMGGSLGSEIINGLARELYSKIGESGEKINFLHSTGNSFTTESLSGFPSVMASDYIPDIHEYIAVADAVISRGGATAIAELLNYNTPGIIIPWPGATENHQYYNALSLEKRELGYVIIESESTVDKVYVSLKKLLSRGKKPAGNPETPVNVIVDYLLQEEEP